MNVGNGCCDKVNWKIFPKNVIASKLFCVEKYSKTASSFEWALVVDVIALGHNIMNEDFHCTLELPFGGYSFHFPAQRRSRNARVESLKFLEERRKKTNLNRRSIPK